MPSQCDISIIGRGTAAVPIHSANLFRRLPLKKCPRRRHRHLDPAGAALWARRTTSPPNKHWTRTAPTSHDPIRHIEIIKNGQIERKVPVAELAKNRLFGHTDFQRERLVPGACRRRQQEDVSLCINGAVLPRSRDEQRTDKQSIGPVLSGLDAKTYGKNQA